jgi:Arc/MetJ family transcription regulator
LSTNVQGIEQSILDEAQRLLGTKNKRDTVNVALREVVRRKLVEDFIHLMAERSPEELDRMRTEAWQ